MRISYPAQAGIHSQTQGLEGTLTDLTRANHPAVIQKTHQTLIEQRNQIGHKQETVENVQPLRITFTLCPRSRVACAQYNG